MQLELGNNIRQLRRRNKKTQEALAEALGVTSQADPRWDAWVASICLNDAEAN